MTGREYNSLPNKQKAWGNLFKPLMSEIPARLPPLREVNHDI
jgi:hypothetical protein